MTEKLTKDAVEVACGCCYEEHIVAGGVSDDWDGGLPVVSQTGEEWRCDRHRSIGPLNENGVGFQFIRADGLEGRCGSLS